MPDAWSAAMSPAPPRPKAPAPTPRAVGEWKSINGCSRFADFDYALNKDSWTSPCASRSEKREDRDKRSGFEPIARPHYSVAALVAAVLRRDSDLTARFESQGAGRRHPLIFEHGRAAF